MLNNPYKQFQENTDQGLSGCYGITPSLTTSLAQGAPFNKYVNENHPGYNVGCVAVASALIMLHSADTLPEFHGRTVYLKSIRDGLLSETSSQSKNNQPVRKIIGGYPKYYTFPTYTYEQSLDSVAKLLYLLSVDLKMQYFVSNGIKTSGAYSVDAFNLLKKLKFDMQTNYASFNLNKVVEHLANGCYVYIDGRDMDKSGGHAFISDGCRYCVHPDDNSIQNVYLHIDWGWGGKSNGYFTGTVFETPYGTYRASTYFAVKGLKINEIY